MNDKLTLDVDKLSIYEDGTILAFVCNDIIFTKLYTELQSCKCIMSNGSVFINEIGNGGYNNIGDKLIISRISLEWYLYNEVR